MPSKAELQKQITELRTSLKDATKRLTTIESLPPGGKHYLPMPKTDLCILNVEKAIGTDTSWGIERNLYERKTAGENNCLPCEEEYFNLRIAIDKIGSAYLSLPVKSWADDEKISGEVKQQLARELFSVEQNAKRTETNCGVNLPKVKVRVRDLKPIAHVGRWDEFVRGREQLLADLEQDLKAVIPNINITGAKPIRHTVPEVITPPKKIPEIEPDTQLYLLQTIEETKRMAEEAKRAIVSPKTRKLQPLKVRIARELYHVPEETSSE